MNADEGNAIHTKLQEKSPSNSIEHNHRQSPDSPSLSFSQCSRVALNPTAQSETIDIQFRCPSTEINVTDILMQNTPYIQHKYIQPVPGEHCTNGTVNIMHNCNSPTKSGSISECRYCYQNIRRNASASQCHCKGNLCKECLGREVALTHNRSNHEMQCTVCKYQYNVTREFKWKCNRDCKVFYLHYMAFCGLKNEQHLLGTLGGKVGFGLVNMGIVAWIFATSYVLAMDPERSDLPISVYYMVSGFDLIVGVATLWFVLKCRWLVPFFLSIFYGLRCIYLLVGWIPIIHFFNISMYKKAHINVMSYFISFSFITFLILTACYVMDIVEQFTSYKIQHQTLTINGIRIEIRNNDSSNHQIYHAYE